MASMLDRLFDNSFQCSETIGVLDIQNICDFYTSTKVNKKNIIPPSLFMM